MQQHSNRSDSPEPAYPCVSLQRMQDTPKNVSCRLSCIYVCSNIKIPDTVFLFIFFSEIALDHSFPTPPTRVPGKIYEWSYNASNSAQSNLKIMDLQKDITCLSCRRVLGRDAIEIDARDILQWRGSIRMLVYDHEQECAEKICV